MIERSAYQKEVSRKLKTNPVVAILGPRQVGKTTLARRVTEGRLHHYFDLEDPVSLARLAHPRSALQPLKGVVVIDEIQRFVPGSALRFVVFSFGDMKSKHGEELLAGEAGARKLFVGYFCERRQDGLDGHPQLSGTK